MSLPQLVAFLMMMMTMKTVGKGKMNSLLSKSLQLLLLLSQLKV